jgi:phosphonopyruvate decarboxylase
LTSRTAAIRSILDRHGTDAVYVACTGYIARATFEVASPDHHVLYMQGSMGLAPAIGLGIASSVETPVVVINGDGALLMSLGTTHTIRDRAPAHLFHYVLDNGCHESVGAQPCAPLEERYPGVTEIIKINREGERPRVGIEPAENAEHVRAFLLRPQRLR